MNVVIILGSLLIFGNHFGYADIRELEFNERQYLAALGNKENREYLPPTKGNNYPNEAIVEETKNYHSYIHSKPYVLYDPLPEKVNFVQPLKIDFTKEQIHSKPILKGAFISGLLLPNTDLQYKAQATNNNYLNTKDQLKENKDSKEYRNFQLRPFAITTQVPRNTNQKHLKIHAPLNTKVEYNQMSSDYKETTTEYKLLNNDDSIHLMSKAPEVIYKPGDDISFLDDTSTIDVYEYVFPSSTLNKPISTHITKSPEYKVVVNNLKSIEFANSDHGYMYDRPKISLNF